MFAFLHIAPRQDSRNNDFAVDEHTASPLSVETGWSKRDKSTILKSLQANGAGALNDYGSWGWPRAVPNKLQNVEINEAYLELIYGRVTLKTCM